MTNKQTEDQILDDIKIKRSHFHVDVPQSVRSHLLGQNHTQRHKFVFGSLIMLLGVSMVYTAKTIDSMLVHIVVDVIGYGLHAIGAIPAIKAIDKEGKL